MVKINGSSFALQYKRTTGRPIDSTATFKTLEDATSYARNTDAEEYFPYPAQIVSVELDGSVYKLLKDETISEADGRKHYKLSPIMTGDDADDKYLSKVEDDSAKGLITFLAGIDVKIKAVVQKLIAEDATFSKEISSKDYVQNLIGWMITPDGHIDAKSLHLRDFLEVPELRYNRVSITSGEDWLAPGGGIIESVNESSQTLTLKLEPGEVANLAVDDICKGIFNNSTGFQTSYFRITQKISNSEFKYTLRSGYSYHPQKAMHFVAYGNFTNAERQKSAYSTKDYKRYLAGVNNWEITSSMVMMQLGDLSNLVISGLDLSGYSAYLRNVYMTGTIKQLSQDGTTEVLVPAFKGEWKAGKYWYYDEVTHNGSTWICIEPSTTQEPSDSSTDWLKEVSKGDPGTPGKDGADGKDGVGVQDVDVLYYLSTSSSTLTGGSWSTTAPAWVNGKYMWSKTRVIYTDGSTTETDPACITGSKGANGTNGEDGRGVTSIVEQYYLSTSSSSLVGGSWSTTAPAWVNGKYIWTRSVITYTDSSSTTTDAICVTGAKGETGIGVKSYREQYYLSTSYSTPAGGSWSYNVPSWTDGKFMWTRTVVTYTDNTTWTSDPVCVTGSAGPSGKGVKSFEVLYYLSTSSSTLTGGSWSTTAPKWEDGKYIWTKTKVTYTDNTTYESSPACLTGGQGKTGLPGAMLRPRGEWKPNTEYYHNDAFIDTVIYNGNNKLCKVTHTSTSTFDSTKWDEFNEFINVATNVLLAQNATIDVLGTSGIFVGNLEKTQGWMITEGAIKHNQTGFELTAEGGINTANGKLVLTSNSTVIRTNTGKDIALFKEVDGVPMIDAKNINTENLVVTSGAILGGWEIKDNNIVSRDIADAKILLEVSGTRFLRINEYGGVSSQGAYPFLSIRNDNQDCINLSTYGKGGVALRIIANTSGGGAIESYGSHLFGQRQYEKWDAPGVLWAGRISSGGGISDRWGDGCYVSSVNRTDTGNYVFRHELGHTNYFIIATGVNENWTLCIISDKQANTFTVKTFHKDQGWINSAFEVAVIGRNRK